jgi:hypothetical protein
MPSSKDPVINRQKAQEYRLAHPDWHRESNKLWARKKRARLGVEGRRTAQANRNWADPIRHLLQIAERRAKEQGIPFNLVPEDLEMPAKCPVLGIEFKWGHGKRGWRNMASPSLDRVKPQLGYVRGNVRVISIRANHVKGNATIRELEAVLAYMKREGANLTLADQDQGEIDFSPESPQLTLF